MGKNAWFTKSLVAGGILGLITFGLSYGFLTIHQETGFSPEFSYKPAILAFLVATIAAAVYFHRRIKR